MEKETLILIHGMGNDTKETLKQEVVSTLNNALKRYKSYENVNIEDEVDIIPIAYNDVFEKQRNKMSESSKNTAESLSNIFNRAQIIEGDLNIGDKLALELSEYESKFGIDSFFYTHWLDVVFYRSLLGQAVRVKVAKELSYEIAKKTGVNVNILAHSLGTSVLHDTLEQLYKNQFDPKDKKEIKQLSTTSHRIGSIWMVSNVSCLLQSFVKVENSIVKPGKEGCCNRFYDVCHKLDPFTKIKPFEPIVNDGWISNEEWLKHAYKNIEIKAVTDLNTHGLGHYLANPCVHIPLLNEIMKFRPKKQERDQALKSFYDETLPSGTKLLQQNIAKIKFLDSDKTVDMIKTAKDLRDIVKELSESIKV